MAAKAIEALENQKENQISEENMDLAEGSELSLDDLDMVAGGAGIIVNPGAVRHYSRHD